MGETTLETVQGHPTLRLTRELVAPLEDVWRAVSEPGVVEAWFLPGRPWMKQSELGRLLGEEQGEPVSSVPASHITWQWDETVFTFGLTEHDGVVQLELLVTIEDRDEAAVAALEFDAFLDRLAPYLAGDEPTFAAFSDVDAQERRLESYAERFGIDRTRGLDFVASVRQALAVREDRAVADGSLDVADLESSSQDAHPGR